MRHGACPLRRDLARGIGVVRGDRVRLVDRQRAWHAVDVRARLHEARARPAGEIEQVPHGDDVVALEALGVGVRSGDRGPTCRVHDHVEYAEVAHLLR